MTTSMECITKQWGSSIGIVIPREVTKKEGIGPDEKVMITVQKTTLAKALWDLGPVIEKRSTQEIKDDLRKGW